jgi:nitroreductase
MQPVGDVQVGRLEAAIMPEKMVPEWEIPARDLYMEYAQRHRDEAVRTGTFAAAAMIYAARSLGLGSTPMIGSDAEAVHREFGTKGRSCCCT